MFATSRSFDTSSYAQLLRKRKRKTNSRAHGIERDDATDNNDPKLGLIEGPETTNCYKLPTQDEDPPDLKMRKWRTNSKSSRRKINNMDCYFCGKELFNSIRYRCQECIVTLCARCYINAPLLHPDHTLQQVPLSSVNDNGQTENIEDVAHDISKKDGDTVQRREACCYLCQRPLLAIKYECDKCSGINFCTDCKLLHPATHTLKAVTYQVRHEGSEYGGHKDTAYPTHIGNGSKVSGPQRSPKPSRYRRMELRSRSRESPITVTLSKESYIQFTSLARAMSRVVDQFVDSQPRQALAYEDDGTSESSNIIDFAVAAPHHANSSLPPRRNQWMPGEKRRLSDLKQRGWTNKEIAQALGRSPGAILQQWRKQRLPQ